jgi:hypothetical protein
MEITQKVVDAMAAKTGGFDNTWIRSLQKWFVYDGLSVEEQKALVKKSGQQTSVILGFDLYPRLSVPGGLPVMAKFYFPPCNAAAATGSTRWQAVSHR